MDVTYKPVLSKEVEKALKTLRTNPFSKLTQKQAEAVVAVLACALFGAACGNELTKETWDAAVAGKTVFVKFLAPW